MPTEGWRFNSIGRGWPDESGGPYLTVQTPGGSVRMMSLDSKELARIIREAAVQLEVQIREGRA